LSLCTSLIFLLLAVAAPIGGAEEEAVEQEPLLIEQQMMEAPPPAPPRAPTVALDAPIDRAGYLIGPSDVFALKLWGEVSLTVSLEVTPEGNFLPPVGGPLTVAGLTIDEATELLRTRLGEYYREIHMTLTLVSPRAVAVHVTGAVERPGQYEATAAMRVSAVIDLAGGIVEEGSQRTIAISGFDGRERTADLVRYRHLGDLSANPLIMEGSRVHVPFQRRAVTVVGAVHRPGTYELVEGDGLQSMLELAGGVRPEANLGDIELVRFREDDPTAYFTTSIDLSGTDPDKSRDVGLAGGDRVFVREIEHWHDDSRVEIEGEVAYPGTYSLVEGEDTLTDLVERAGGLTQAADLSGAVLRRRAASLEETAIDRAVTLIEGFGRAQLSEEEYSFLSSQKIELADQVSVDFVGLLEEGDAAEDVRLLNGDLLTIPRALHVVRVSGAVRDPGFVKHEQGADVEHYLALAGGYTSEAYKSRVRIVKSQSGSRVRPSKDVAIEPGDTVWVPRTPDRDWWEITKEVLIALAQVATIYLVIDSVNR